MTATTADRLEVRVDSRDKSTIEHAARLQGKKTSVFVREVALREAQRVLTESTTVTLSPEESRARLDAFDRPFTPNPRLARAMKRAERIGRR